MPAPPPSPRLPVSPYAPPPVNRYSRTVPDSQGYCPLLCRELRRLPSRSSPQVTRPPRLIWPPSRPADRASSDVHSCAVPFLVGCTPAFAGNLPLLLGGHGGENTTLSSLTRVAACSESFILDLAEEGSGRSVPHDVRRRGPAPSGGPGRDGFGRPSGSRAHREFLLIALRHAHDFSRTP